MIDVVKQIKSFEITISSKRIQRVRETIYLPSAKVSEY